MFVNIQSRIGLKQFVIMATGCTTSSRCKIVTVTPVEFSKILLRRKTRAPYSCATLFPSSYV